MESIKERVHNIIREQLRVDDEDEIKDSDNLEEDLGADDLDMVEILMSIEEEFTMDVDDDDFSKVVTVGDVVKYVEDNK